MSCPTPAYGVTMLVTPPADTLTQGAFFQEATVRCWATGVQYLAVPSIFHTPAYLHSDLLHTFQMDARTEYTVQVRDLSTGGFGHHCFTASGPTPNACLSELATKLSELDATGPARAAQAQPEKTPAAYDHAA
ncbi:MAG: hypothetical protein ACRYG7_19455 [Janthinobacterium lividum]